MAHDAIIEIVTEVREYLETVWPEPEDSDYLPSRDMCGRSSSVLASVLNKAGVSDWRVAGGAEDVRDSMNASGLIPMATEGGMQDIHGCWHDHYWVESKILGLLADVTADQFGQAEVTVCGIDDPRYHANWMPNAVDRHVSDWKREAGEWLSGFQSRSNTPGGPR